MKKTFGAEKSYLKLLAFLLGLALLGAAWLFRPRPAAVLAREAFVIDSYHIDMEVRADNSYLITEHIKANFTEQRHGLIRVLPRKTYNHYSIDLRDVKANTPLELTETTEDWELRLGSADTYVKGPIDYEISYIYDIGEDGLRDMDELYFNLIGTDWDSDISAVSFRITMPKPFSAAKLNFTCGALGSRAQAPLDLEVSERVIEGRLLTKLGPHEGLTVALPLPEGYFDGSLRSGLNRWAVAEPIIYGAALLAAAAVGLLLRRQNRRTVQTEFYAPEGLNPADAYYLYTGEVSDQAISAVIMHWVNKGYLRMEEVRNAPAAKTAGSVTAAGRQPEQELILTPLLIPETGLKAPEQRLLKAFLARQDEAGRINVTKLPPYFHEHFETFRKGTADYWTKNKERQVEDGPKGRKIRLSLQILSYALIWLMCWRTFAEVEMAPVSFILAFVASFFVFWLAVVLLGGCLGRQISGRRVGAGMFIVSLLGVLFSEGGMLVIAHVATPSYRVIYNVAAFAAALLIYIIALNCRLLTPYGKQLLGRLDGFKNFLQTTARPDQAGFDAHYFTHNMAYAYALNLGSAWAKSFARLMEDKLGAEEAAPWRDYAFDYLDHFKLQVRQLKQTVARTPRSSSGASSSSSGGGSGGSSSGGSSGGGSGGGGGRSW